VNLLDIIIIILSALALLVVITRIIFWPAGRQGKRIADEIIAKSLAGELEAEYSSPIQITHDNERITLFDTSDEKEVSISWDNVRKVDAYKRDLLTYDMVCVSFETLSEQSIEVDEGMKGFTELMEEASSALPGLTKFSDWYLNITQPAFATNLTPLYERQSAEPDEMHNKQEEET